MSISVLVALSRACIRADYPLGVVRCRCETEHRIAVSFAV